MITLLPATVDHLLAFQRDPAEFAALIGGAVPEGWPEFPEAFDFTVSTLQAHPEQAQWWMHFFLEDGNLVGSGGFVGPPQERTVEIGYEIAPRHRGRGLATAAATAMVDKARATGDVDAVIAHTLAEDNPSTGVLRKIGFSWAGALTHPEDGELWRWRLVF